MPSIQRRPRLTPSAGAPARDPEVAAERRVRAGAPRDARPGTRLGGRTTSRRTLVAAALAAIVLAALAPAVRPPVAVAGTTGLGPLTFYGRGYGHGVGMSQYGARGRALAGQLAPQILAHYFPTTTLGSRGPGTPVRVLLLTGFSATASNPLAIVGLDRRGWKVDGIPTVFPMNARLALVPTAPKATTWALRVTSSTGTLLAARTVSGDLYVRPASTAGVLRLVPKPSTANVYRGYFRIHLTTTAMVIDHVPLDAYLRGVVPLEMPTTWPIEALKAQAIAARSYAAYRLHPSSGSFDVYDDTRSQVYRGRRAETPVGDAVVAATAGQVLVSGSSVANALYHSADGGWTENNENVFVSSSGAIVSGAVPYLRGSSDRAPDGSSYDKASPYATWSTATYTAAALGSMFGRDSRTAVGTLTAIDLSRRGVSGRLISVTLVGSLGTKTVSGDVFRAVFNATRPAADPQLRDTLFDTSPIP